MTGTMADGMSSGRGRAGEGAGGLAAAAFDELYRRAAALRAERDLRDCGACPHRSDCRGVGACIALRRWKSGYVRLRRAMLMLELRAERAGARPRFGRHNDPAGIYTTI